jgi:hypothetical protein
MQLEINHDLEVTNVKYEDHEGEKVGKRSVFLSSSCKMHILLTSKKKPSHKGASPHLHKRQLSLAYSYKSTNEAWGADSVKGLACVLMYLIYVHTLDSSKRENRHALSDMLFCVFLDYNNKTL